MVMKFFLKFILATALCLLSFVTVNHTPAESLHGFDPASVFGHDPVMASLEKKEKGIRGPVTGWHLYWEDGYLTFEDRRENILFMINGQILADAGYIQADEVLDEAFPELAGSHVLFRKLNISTYGNLYDTVDFKIGFDFANAREIQDIWIRYLKHPYIRNIKIGHQKEPFSMEYLTSVTRITFMERALPDHAFNGGRNIGIRYDSQNGRKRLNFGLGLFLNTGSFSDIGEAQNQIEEANGLDMALRVFGHPRYDDNGRQLVHLGLGYTHGVRDEDNTSAPMQFRSRPESRLTNERLVDSGPILGPSLDRATAELAVVAGPWSFQTQGYYTSLNADAFGDPHFWGYYAFLSYHLTGENRRYNPDLGIFTGVDPQPAFRPLQGDWGAWELAFRHSYLDLNDGDVNGGRESNITAGLNWTFNRNARIMFNYIHARVKDRENPIIDDGTANIVQIRYQVIW